MVPLFTLIQFSTIPLKLRIIFHYVHNSHLISYLLPFCTHIPVIKTRSETDQTMSTGSTLTAVILFSLFPHFNFEQNIPALLNIQERTITIPRGRISYG